MKYFFFFIIISTANISYSELLKPQADLLPEEVISIQLTALQNNNHPYKNAGIEQTWEFAHPNNKAMTGPLEKFKQMIYSRSYKILLEHENNEITILNETNNRSVYKVYILSKEKKSIIIYGK